MATEVEKLPLTDNGTNDNKNPHKELSEIQIIPTIGIIYPPTEIRSIIDKTAEFVAKNGIEFEEKIKTREAQNNKFNFLNRNDPYFMYYKHVLSEYQANPSTEKLQTRPTIPTWVVPAQEQKPVAPQPFQRVPISKKRRTIIDMSEPTQAPSAPPTYEYFIEAPVLAQVDLDTIKITSQFVARNGKSFLQSLLQREVKNYLFDFLKPQHNLFTYFNKLTEQYTKILAPSNDTIKLLKEESNSINAILDKVRQRYEWVVFNDKERRKEDDEAEKGAVLQIDWQEFAIVEVIGFREDEKTNLPPPVTLEQLGARVLAQERYEKLSSEDHFDPSQNSFDKSSNKGPIINNIVPVTESIPANAPILKDYDPKHPSIPQKTETVQSKPKGAEKMMVSPITGELVPADQMEQHLKISLLDPRWKEQKQRLAEEKRQQDLLFETGISIGTHLKDLAQRRSDIFGPGHEETVIGRKLDEKDDPNIKRAAPVHWESKTTTQMAYRMGPTPATIDKQLETFQSRAAAAAGDTLPTVNPNPYFRPQGNIPVAHMHQPSIPPLYLPQPGVPQPPYTPQGMPPPPGMMPVPQNYYGYPPPQANYYEQDQNSNRGRVDEELISPEEFIAAYGNGPINIQVRIPDMPDLVKRNKWQLQGQIEHLSVIPSSTIAALKAQLQQTVGLPPSKQKILIGLSRFAKDSNTCAFYNLNPSSHITLQLKERSRKK